METISMEQYNLLKTKHERLVDLVRRMRGLQREEKKYRGMIPQPDKDRKRALERQCDSLIIEEIKTQQSKQSNLF